MNILNIGSLNIDYVYEVSHFVRPGESINAEKIIQNSGGKGLNQSVAMSKAGLSVSHAGFVGEADGDFLIRVLQENKVDTGLIEKIDLPSGNAVIQVVPSGENCIIVYNGANKQLTEAYIDMALSRFSPGDYCVLQNEINRVPEIIRRAHQKGLKVILNPSPIDSELLSADFSGIDLMILNEIEGRQITGKTDPDEIIRSLLERSPDTQYVLTLGQDGAVYADRDRRLKCGIYPAEVVDTTAAGDTFTGYFIYSIVHQLPVADGLRIASAASAVAVSRNGAAQSIPYRREVLEYIEAYGDLEIVESTRG